jgi:hypothetical protein
VLALLLLLQVEDCLQTVRPPAMVGCVHTYESQNMDHRYGLRLHSVPLSFRISLFDLHTIVGVVTVLQARGVKQLTWGAAPAADAL